MVTKYAKEFNKLVWIGVHSDPNIAAAWFAALNKNNYSNVVSATFSGSDVETAEAYASVFREAMKDDELRANFIHLTGRPDISRQLKIRGHKNLAYISAL